MADTRVVEFELFEQVVQVPHISRISVSSQLKDVILDIVDL